MANYKENYISLEEYKWYQKIGLTYDGFITGVGYAYTRNIAIAPAHMGRHNPPRFVPPGMDHYIQGRVQYLDTSEYAKMRSYKITPEDIMKEITTIDNSNQTITVNMGNGQYITLPQDNSNIKVIINDNLEELSLIIRATNTLTLESRETRNKLADFSTIFGNYGDKENLKGNDTSSNGDAQTLMLLGLGLAADLTQSKALNVYNKQATNWLYADEFYGSVETGWTSANPKLSKIATGAKWLGRGVIIVSAFISIRQIYEAHQKGDSDGVVKAGLDLGVGLATAAIGGVPGVLIYLLYMAVMAPPATRFSTTLRCSIMPTR